MRKKNSPKFVFGDYEKNPELILITMFKTYLYAKFGDFSLKNEFRNVKIYR